VRINENKHVLSQLFCAYTRGIFKWQFTQTSISKMKTSETIPQSDKNVRLIPNVVSV